MSWVIGINLGESFIEMTATNLLDKNSSKKPLTQISYLVTESIAVAVKKFLTTYEISEVQKVWITSSRLHKILDKKLGTSVACIFTSGFEKWALIRQPPTSDYFEISPERYKFPSSEELIFGLSERINIEGKVEQELLDSELEFLNSKLKLMDVKRICINLLHAHRNSVHEAKAADYFNAQGFEVYTPEHHSDSSRDEVQAWRKNILNASLTGTSREIHEEVKLAFEGVCSQISFLDSSGQFQEPESSEHLATLWSSIHTMKYKYKTPSNNVLVLGLENLYLLNSDEVNNSWKSHWGPVEVNKPKYYRLATQLTLGIELSLFGEICFTKVEEGFEPGPMFWGRSQKPLLVDILLMEHLSTGSILEKFAPFKQGSAKNIAQRIQNSINVLTKNIKTQDPIEPEEFASILAEKFFSHLSVEIILNATSDQLILTGPLAPYLIKQLRAHLPLMKISLDPQAAHSESQSVLEWAKDHPMSQTTQHQEL